MIGEQDLTPALLEQIQLIFAYQRLQVAHGRVLGEDVVPFGSSPKFPKLAVIQKNVWGIWSVRTVDEIVESTIQEQCGSIRIKKHGRKPIVVVVDN